MAKTVLITGCSTGIGRETARTFLENRWTVYATARDRSDIESLGTQGCNIDPLDVTQNTDVERVVDRIITEPGKIDCLVNNAAYG